MHKVRRRRASAVLAAGAAVVGTLAVAGTVPAEAAVTTSRFERVATIYADENVGSIAAEIVTASADGNTIIYSDSPGGLIGFVDITDPANPVPAGTVDIVGEPTSVTVVGSKVLVTTNTSPSYVAPSGNLDVIDIPTRALDRQISLGGQPDSVAVSPDGQWAAVVIENERDESVSGGAIPQLPGGFLVVVDLTAGPAAVASWTTTPVDLAGLADHAPTDPEPEFVDINAANQAVVTLQENNHVVLIDLPTKAVINDWSAGTAAVSNVDNVRNKVIELTGSLTEEREPDAVAWIGNRLATANEGDLQGGSRGFTVFNTDGSVFWDAGNSVERTAVRHGHFLEKRASSKGVEVEGLETGVYAPGGRLLFVGAERGGFVNVYSVVAGVPTWQQTLPTGARPEGLLAIPARNLFVTANEGDPAAGLPSTLSIFQRRVGGAIYPTISSLDDATGQPISWGALSGLSPNPARTDELFAVQDSFFDRSTIFRIRLAPTPGAPARIREALRLKTLGGAYVNYDLEGVAARADGSYWVVTEGAGNAPTSTSTNRLVLVQPNGKILAEYSLPIDVADDQVQYGFEGVTTTGTPGVDEKVYVTFQRGWLSDPAGKVRLGVFDAIVNTWTFLYYDLDPAESPNGGWVGLSDITSIDGAGRFAIVERDNQAGRNARIKRVYEIDVTGVVPQPEGGVIPTVSKSLRKDLVPDLDSTGGLVLEKVEGLAIGSDGRVWAVTDNDGVDTTVGETMFWQVGERATLFP